MGMAPQRPAEETIEWLLGGDPAIRWQVKRDLLDAPAGDVDAERARVATGGWGKRLLDHQDPSGTWAGGLYGPKWTSTTYTLRLLRLPRELRELVGTGRLDAGHARALLALEGADEQVALGREAARKGLSVRDVERRVALARITRKARGAGARKDANTRAAEERLRAALGSRVEVARRGRGGTVRIRFGSEAELQRLFDLLVRAGRRR